MPAHVTKWTAFVLSAIVPGAGQLAAGSSSCLAWFLTAGLWAGVAGRITHGGGDNSHWLMLSFLVGAGMLFCLASAEHAKRLLEPRGDRKSAVESCRVWCSPIVGRQLETMIELEISRSREELWKLVGDLPRFLTIDPFHDEVTLMRDQPAVGVDLVLSHNACGRRFLRFGKIVHWREGQAYTYSDLSPRGPRVGFPHVFLVRLDDIASPPANLPLTRLTVRIRGRWTSPWVPAALGQGWVWLVCREHARILRKYFSHE